MKRAHSMPFGAETTGPGEVRFRLWAPGAGSVELLLGTGETPMVLPMEALADGWFELRVAAAPGTRYRFRVDGGLAVADPASRFNPDDVHGASEVIAPDAFAWEDGTWTGRPWEEAVIYEIHVGTFSPEGTFAGVERRLDYLAGLGVTALELMPVADFPGRYNWGYDGVLPFAPDSSYGRPEDLKHLIQEAHRRGLMVLLDVVYNHFGPEGNYLHVYARDGFFTERHHTPWGAAINFDGPGSAAVRRFFIDNALYWIEEYGLDGLRLDAVHAILDDSACARARRDRPSGAGGSGSHARGAPGARERRESGALPRPHGDRAAALVRRPVERRPPPRLARAPDRGARRLLRRLRAGPAPTSGPLPRRGLRLPGRGIPLSCRQGARGAERPSAADRLRRLPAEPRPDRQPRLRRAARRARPARRPGTCQRHPAARPLPAAAVHGRGARGGRAFPLLLRFRPRAGRRGHPRAALRVRALRAFRRPRRPRRDPRSEQPRDLCAQPARLGLYRP